VERNPNIFAVVNVVVYTEVEIPSHDSTEKVLETGFEEVRARR
jgi:hypothetical protein